MKYDIGDRVNFRKFTDKYPIEGTIINIHYFSDDTWKYEIDWDVRGLIPPFKSEELLFTTTQQQRENKLRKLGI